MEAVLSSLKPMFPALSEIIYPESDGTPMGETEIHVLLLTYLLDVLKDFFHDISDVYVAGNMFFYYEKGNPNAAVAPDIFVVFGVPKKERRTYRLWEENQCPQVVFELISHESYVKDRNEKWNIYQRLGVKEYYMFDPLGECKERYRLTGYQVVPGRGLVEVEGNKIISPWLGLTLVVKGKRLWLYETKTGDKLMNYRESSAARRKEQEARLKAERKAKREETARFKAEAARLKEEEARLAAEEKVQKEETARLVAEEKLKKEETARYKAEQEIARLRAEIDKLKVQRKGVG